MFGIGRKSKNKCQACGQWAGKDHQCPANYHPAPNRSHGRRNADPKLARTRAQRKEELRRAAVEERVNRAKAHIQSEGLDRPSSSAPDYGDEPWWDEGELTVRRTKSSFTF